MVRTTSNACAQRLAALAGSLLAISWFAAIQPVTAGVVTNPYSQPFLAGGQAMEIGPPASLEPGKVVDANLIKVLREREKYTLVAPVFVDVVGAGVVNRAQDLSFGKVYAGTKINSYMIHADAGDAADAHPLTGTAEFEQPIIGVMISESTLSRTDASLGAQETTYPTSEGRGLELDDGDWFEVSSDRRTLRFNLNLVGSLDQIRVITLADEDQSSTDMSDDGLPMTGGGIGGGGMGGGGGIPPAGGDVPLMDDGGSGAGPRQYGPSSDSSIKLPDNPTDLMTPDGATPDQQTIPPTNPPSDPPTNPPTNPPENPQSPDNPNNPTTPAPGALMVFGLGAAAGLRRRR